MENRFSSYQYYRIQALGFTRIFQSSRQVLDSLEQLQRTKKYASNLNEICNVTKKC